jgi:hypothetical protein
MSAPPVIVTIRPGVSFVPGAAASWLRMEADAGRPIDCNSSYRDWSTQYQWWLAWEAYANGRGPRPPHGRAIHPDKSMHCRGVAADTDDWALLLGLADHGWRRTAADEAWHFEYQYWNDKHRNRPAGGVSTPLPTPEPTPKRKPRSTMYMTRNTVAEGGAVRLHTDNGSAHVPNPTARDIITRVLSQDPTAGPLELLTIEQDIFDNCVAAANTADATLEANLIELVDVLVAKLGKAAL